MENVINSKPNNGISGLTLYYHPYSLFSQKIMMVLYEKKIPFSMYQIDLVNHDQYTQWFLELNPKGEVPVLQDGSLIIPESSRIISYLEDHYQGESIPKLLPRQLDTKVLTKILDYNRKISRVPIGVISIGTFIHPFLCNNSKPPFDGLIQNLYMTNRQKANSVLEKYIESNSMLADLLLQRFQSHEKIVNFVSDKTEFLKLIDELDSVLGSVENELNRPTHLENDEMWLCCEQFTIADISLAILLYRLYCLGMEDYYWIGKRPGIEAYFTKLNNRESFQRILIPEPIQLETIEEVKENGINENSLENSMENSDVKEDVVEENQNTIITSNNILPINFTRSTWNNATDAWNNATPYTKISIGVVAGAIVLSGILGVHRM